MFFRKRDDNRSLFIAESLCIACQSCVDRCRRRVLDMKTSGDRDYVFIKYPIDCTACGKCAAVCPTGAIKLITVKRA